MFGVLNSLHSSFKMDELRDSVNPAHPRDPVLATLFGDNSGGPVVTPESAMRVTSVYASVSLISETLAALPKHVYKLEDKKSAKMTDHPLYAVVHDTPARGMTSFEWHEMQISHTALRGDSYSRIILGRDGRVMELSPILPTHIKPFRARDGKVSYRWWPDGVEGQRVLFDDEVLRIPYKMLDGLNSLSPISTHRQTIGNSLAANRFLQSFYKNSAQPKGALMVDEALNADAAKALRDSWEERHQGSHNAGRVAVFDGGMKWESIGMSMDDAQYLELQQFSVSDVARIFLVPPHKIGDLSNATFSNIEHQAIEFVVDTILRWVRRIEMRYNAYLLSAQERASGIYVGFDLKGLLRGDANTRSNFYRALFYIGALTPNEIRAAEDLNPYEGGDEYYIQGATVPISKLDEMTGVDTGGGVNSAVQAMVDGAISKALEEIEKKGQLDE